MGWHNNLVFAICANQIHRSLWIVCREGVTQQVSHFDVRLVDAAPRHFPISPRVATVGQTPAASSGMWDNPADRLATSC